MTDVPALPTPPTKPLHVGVDTSAPRIESTLMADLTKLLSHAEQLKEQAGRSPEGRWYSMVCSELEQIQAFVGYKGL